MTATRQLPATMLDRTGAATFVALQTLCNEAARRGLRYVPINVRPARLGTVDALWLDSTGNVALILRGATLTLTERA